MNAKTITFACFCAHGRIRSGLIARTLNRNPPSNRMDKPTPEKKAILLLEQIIGEAGGLKLPENRIYIRLPPELAVGSR
jgi:hypothetical protein